MNLKEYLLRVEKSQKYRIKSVRPIEDSQMDVIERVLKKYRPKDMSRPKKLMFQTKPLGWTGPNNVEIWYVDVELTIPVAATALEYELEERLGLKYNSNALQVVSENDPRHCCMDDEGEEELEGEDEEGKALLLDPEYKEVQPINVDDHSGTAYNKKLTDYLKGIQDARKDDPSHAAADKAGEPEIDATDFNKDVGGEKAKYSTIKKSAHKAGPLKTGK